MFATRSRWLSLLAALVMLLTAMPYGGTATAQAGTRTFPETGKTVKGRFLEYWDTHGGLPQQGFPISEEMQEVSDTDGKTYTVQYFERAVFEAHPEFARPNDVLLSLLGVFLYQQKYPSGAPGQTPNAEANSRVFPETGKRVGGIFLEYWNTHGGLAQQGLPISDEFQEVSDLNGQTYKVQYFERAVFEFHPENAPPFNVLLSQLGTFRYRAKYLTPSTPTVAPTTPTPVPPAATPVPPLPTNTPQPSCDTSGNRNGEATPSSVRVGQTTVFRARGFQPNEDVSFWFTTPSGIVVGTPAPVPGGVNPDGSVGPLPFTIDPAFPEVFGYGRWAITFQGASSNNVAVIYFCIER
jgi:hypothetical protein